MLSGLVVWDWFISTPNSKDLERRVQDLHVGLRVIARTFLVIGLEEKGGCDVPNGL